LDHTADKVFSNVAFVILLVQHVILVPIALLFILRDILVFGFKEILLAKGVAITPSILSKIKTFFIYTALIVIPFYNQLGLLICYLSLILAYITAFMYYSKINLDA